MTILESETRFAFDFASGNERYDDVNLMGRRVMDVSQFGITGRIRGDYSLMVQYRCGKFGSVAVTVAYDLVLEVAMKNSTLSIEKFINPWTAYLQK